MEANEYIFSHKDDNRKPPTSGGNPGKRFEEKSVTNKGTLTRDATCAPANIRYPQDISLLTEAREKKGKHIKTIRIESKWNAPSA